MNPKRIMIAAALLVGICLIGCDRSNDSISSGQGGDYSLPELASLQSAAWPPSHSTDPTPMVDVTFNSHSVGIWPYTGGNLEGDPKDPINLVFIGEADPRDIRAALLGLDGDRTAYGMPPVPPFNSTWDDAIGEVQSAYSNETGWVPGAIQLACGDYHEVRVHLRLFKVGPWTLGGAHFEVLIPGTTDHQVLSWEVAKEFVTVDFMRSGLLDPDIPAMPTGAIHQSPFRTIPGAIYSLLPDELKDVIGNPPADADGNYPIYTNGEAVILNLVDRADRVAETRVQDLPVQFDQVVPKPFCAESPYDMVYVSGPVTLTQTSTLDEYGDYSSVFHARGELQVIPIDPSTGEFIGDALTARVRELHKASLTDGAANAVSVRYQGLYPTGADGSGWFFERFKIGCPGADGYQLITRCEFDEAGPASVVAAASSVDTDGSIPAERLMRIR